MEFVSSEAGYLLWIWKSKPGHYSGNPKMFEFECV